MSTKPGRPWRIAALLSAVLLLSSGNLCMLFLCTPQDARTHRSASAPMHPCCAAADSRGDHRPDPAPQDGARPCRIVVTLAAGPHLDSPHVQPLPAILALAATLPDEAALKDPTGAPAQVDADPPPTTPSHDASGVRAPPIA